MDKFFRVGFFLLVVVVIVSYIFKGRSDKAYERELQSQKIELDEKISRLESDNRKIATDLAVKMDSLTILESEMAKNKNKKIAIIKYYEKRIRNIDTLSDPELDSMFRARYPSNQ